MKIFFFVTICSICYACFPEKELQAKVIYATLIKVEEVNRYPNIKQKVLTWQTDEAISFVTIEPFTVNIPVGTQTRVLIHR